MSYRGTGIMGSAAARLAQLEAVVRRIHPNPPDVAGLYLSFGPQLGVRGDLAYAQALLETNYFRYGSVVKPEQNNYCGLGATGPDNPGHSFATPAEGVMAHLQHLYAYASLDPLPDGMELVDPRFGLVQRGSARYLGELNGKWAVPGTTYGQSIDRILGTILAEPSADEPYQITQAHLDPTSQNRPGACTSSGCWQGVFQIVVHRTASNTMDARAIRHYFNTAPDGRFASSQYVLDNHEILQLMPVGEVAYHTSGKNFTTLGIETCEHNWGSDTWPETYRKLVWLTAYLARAYGLSISDVTGHFYWDRVNRPYDPTHMGWSPSQGKATGLFEWNQFITDVQAQMAEQQPAPEPAPPQTVPVRVQRVVYEECTEGLLLDTTTYVPIRAYTGCVVPGAQIRWDEATRTVTVELPPGGEGTSTGSPKP